MSLQPGFVYIYAEEILSLTAVNVRGSLCIRNRSLCWSTCFTQDICCVALVCDLPLLSELSFDFEDVIHIHCRNNRVLPSALSELESVMGHPDAGPTYYSRLPA